MTIDVEQPQSDGWWLDRLARKLTDRQPRLRDLDDRFRGEGPLPEGSETNDFYKVFQRKARTNFARLIVQAKANRMHPIGFRTAVVTDEAGDAEAMRVWNDNGLPVESADVHRGFLNLGDSYVIVGRGDDGRPVITAEDARQVITIHDPAQQRKVRAAAKFFYDDELELEVAYLYRPGYIRRAVHPRKPSKDGRVRFFGKSWDWDGDPTVLPDPDMVPVVRFRNIDETGEFEPHVDVLDRIDHQVLQRMVIATLQAFRQRAIVGAPMEDEEGNAIDWKGLLVAAPGENWIVPTRNEQGEAVSIWESSQADLTPILSASKDDIHHVAAVTSTPLHIFMPDAVNGSAEGASVLREEAGFAVEDRIRRASESWRDVMSTAFRMMGDTARADRSRIEVLWASPDRKSAAELADAAVKKASIGVTWRQSMGDLGYTPEQIDRMASERVQEQLMAAAMAATFAPQPAEEPQQAPTVVAEQLPAETPS